LQMRANTVKHLEILETYSGQRQGSLLHAIDRTKTSVGARLLRQWLLFPLLEQASIENRQRQVAFWIENFNPSPKSPGVKVIREHLSNMGDIERRLGKICHPNANPRDLQSLAQSLQEGLVLASKTRFYNYSESGIRAADQIVSIVNEAFMDEVPLHFNKDYFVKKGFRKDLDEWIDLTTHGEDKILQMEETERQATGISSLKIRYNQVFGYYIEVTNTHKDKIPKTYIRKQTLTNAERFTTEALQDLETKILSARAKRFELENAVFKEIKDKILAQGAYLIDIAGQWAEIDVYTSLSYLAVERKYVRPRVLANSKMKIEGARHPVIEQLQKDVFVPNDIDMASGEVMLLTGPNMAGKSTIMRQVAICQIMAQMGSYIPAKSAELPLIDRIFTRIGASDSLSEGLSTFMVEMVETAEIFKSLTTKSLVIMDEIGRGTSTFDGMSLAQAILEEMLHKNSSFGFFATHYHELTRIAQTNQRLKNAHMSISDRDGDLKFLYKLKDGAASKSYGIHVAKLAGLSKSITDRAKIILNSLESGQNTEPKVMQMDLFTQDLQTADPAWIEDLKAVEVEGMTPIQALNYLVGLKDLANNDAN
ncbi:MAG: DNA mismatch repair protein MutS, partial [Bdellovibrionales bacterium]|nr:DNA mismatch repair protein MutS [Bdellovibrionales bacterium]